MDYLPGKDISSYLDEEGCFSEEKARFYICECIAALDALHNRGIIYRDFKPNNIILDNEGHVKLIDFNLCKTGVKSYSERTYSFCGTIAYMPPEIINRKGYGKAVDWYSLGVVLYEMLFGIPPYFDKSPKVTEKRILKSELNIPKGASPECVDLIQKLLQK